MDTLNNSFHRFIVGQCTEAVILGTLCIIGMMIFRFPYAVMIGVLIGATALIPIFGAYIGGAVGFIMIVTVSPIKALFFVLFLVVLQQLEGQLIYPRVVGSSIGLPGILVFSAVTVGASLFGIAGVLLGIPLMAAAYQILKDDLRAREKPVKKKRLRNIPRSEASAPPAASDGLRLPGCPISKADPSLPGSADPVLLLPVCRSGYVPYDRGSRLR